MFPNDRPHDHAVDQDRDRDRTARARGDWWTVLTDWLADRPPHAEGGGEGRVIAHRGPDGRIYYGCLIPPDAVPIRANDPDITDGAQDGSHIRWAGGYAADRVTGDLVEDDGSG